MKRTLIKPNKLNPGDLVAAIAPSWAGPGTLPHRFEAGVKQMINEFEVNVVEMPHTRLNPETSARHPEKRAADLMMAVKDPSIKAIICAIGGEDSLRLYPHLDLSAIRDNPKIFMGYSDTTSLHLMFYQAGVQSYYGPSIMSGFGENAGLHDYMVDHVRRTLFSTDVIGVIDPVPAWTVQQLNWENPANQLIKRTMTPNAGRHWLSGTGRVTGPLLGGCFEVLEGAKGTPFWPSLEEWTGAIMFLETSEEANAPRLLTYAMRNYAAIGILDRIAALIVGRPGGSDLDDGGRAAYDDAIMKVVRDEEGLTIPVVTHMDFGHTDPMMVLPYGAMAEINCDQKTFSILDAGVH